MFGLGAVHCYCGSCGTELKNGWNCGLSRLGLRFVCHWKWDGGFFFFFWICFKFVKCQGGLFHFYFIYLFFIFNWENTIFLCYPNMKCFRGKKKSWKMCYQTCSIIEYKLILILAMKHFLGPVCSRVLRKKNDF